MNDKQLTLSIVIPAYTEEDHIKNCLDAIAKQTVKPWQVIVVDNNSTDKTAEIAKTYDFVTLLREVRQGKAHARNKGFNAVTADLIGRIDADTIIPLDWVETAIEFMKSHTGEALTGGGYFYDLAMPRFFGWYQKQIAFRANRFIMGYYITWGSNMVITSKMWQDVKHLIHNDNDIHEDMDLAIHLHEKGYKITYHANWEVGVDSRTNERHKRNTQMEWLRLWPRTFRRHNLPRAWIGDIGMYIVYASWYPTMLADGVVSLYKSMRQKITGRR